MLAPPGGAARIVVVRREHELERVDDVFARLLPCAALTDRARDFDDARDDPTVLVRLVVLDRHLQLLVHHSNDNAECSARRLTYAGEPCFRVYACERRGAA